ncbi:MAG: ribosome maturation factor RimP [Gemmatimonadota bacterium]
MEQDELERAVEAQVGSLGFELVELEQAGAKTRPLLRVRIDRPGSEPGKGVTIEDCAQVSRALERYLEESGEVAERYVLEVSSPGIERPLRKRGDYERFAGREVAIKAQHAIGDHGKRLEGLLLGVKDKGGRDEVQIELPSKEVVSIPRDEVVRAKLIFRWEA